MNGPGARRAQVDLSEYFSDYKKNSLVFINPQSIKIIQDLKNHICQLFDLIDDFEIFIGDIHVPNLESVHVIEDEDIIRVRRVAYQTNAKNDSIKKKVYINEQKSQEVVSQRKEEKNKKKRLKSGENTNEMCTVENDKQIVVNDEEEPELKRKRKNRENKQTLGSSVDLTTESSDANASSLCNVDKRKKKHKYELKDEISGSAVQTSTPVSKGIYSNDTDSIQAEPYTKAGEIKVLTEKDYVPVDGPSCKNITDDNFNLVSCNSESIMKSSEDITDVSPMNQNVEGEILDSGIKLDVAKKRRRRPRRKKQQVGVTALPPKPSQTSKDHQCKTPCIFKSGARSNTNKHLRFSDDEDIGEEYEEDQIMVVESGSMALDALDDNIIISHPSSIQNISELIVKNVTDKNYGSTGIVENEGSSAAEVEVIEECDQIPQVKEKSPKEIPSGADVTVGTSLNCDLQVKNSDPLVDSVIQSKSDKGSVASYARSRANRRKNVIIAKSIGSTLLHLMGESNKSEGTKKNNQEIDPTAVIKPRQNFPKSDSVTEPQMDKKDRKYKGFPVLQAIPRQGDILAFKILKLNENYEPSVSDYMEGKVTRLDLDKNSVRVRVLAGAHELRKTAGKFDLEEEESTTQMDDESEVNIELKWNEFIEPRIVFP